MCEYKKRTTCDLPRSNSETLKREFIVRAKNIFIIIRAITLYKYSVLEMIGKITN